ncbi:unnamed protein product [Rhodiola kirilowii]
MALRSMLTRKSLGGFAFSTMAALAARDDLRAAEAAREMAWEQLHSGPWSSVLPVWRDAYSMACLHVAKAHYASGEFKEAFRVLDMGLLMGGTLLRKDLDAAIGKMSAKTMNGDAVLERNRNGKEDEVESQRSDCGRSVNDEAEITFHAVTMDFQVKTRRLSALQQSQFADVLVCTFSGGVFFVNCDYFLSGSPVIISDCMAHWPARKKWGDIEYLRRVAGERTVPLEVGKNYFCSEWKQELITFLEFLMRLQSNDTSEGPTYLAELWKYVRLYSAAISDELYLYSETMLQNSSKCIETTTNNRLSDDQTTPLPMMMMMQRGGSSDGRRGSISCQDCGNQAKK